MATTSMHAAARTGDIARIEELLGQGEVIDQRHFINTTDTPLIWAAYYGVPASVTWLLDRGAAINHRGENGGTPLYWAINQSHWECALQLLQRGADPNLAAEDGTTPLSYLAARTEEPSDAEAQVILMLRRHGADLDAVVQGRPVRHIAADNANRRRGVLITEGARLDVDAQVEAPVRAAVVPEAPLRIASTINPGVSYETMHGAARSGDIEAMEAFLANGRDVDTVHPRNPLDTPLIWAGYFNTPISVHWLIEHGADIDHRGELGRTALHWAIVRGYFLCACLLLQEGATHTIADDASDRPALVMARRTGPFAAYERELITMLRLAGADIEATVGLDGRTAMQVIRELGNPHRVEAWTAAVEEVEVDYLAIAIGAQPDEDDASGEESDDSTSAEAALATALGIHRPRGPGGVRSAPRTTGAGARVLTAEEEAAAASLSVAPGGAAAAADVREDGKPKPKSLHAAARMGDIAAMEAFLRNGHTVDEINENNKKTNDTALVWAAYFNQPASIRFLLDHGAAINHRGEDGGTPLYWATRRRQDECALLLLERGADPNIRSNERGYGPIHELAWRPEPPRPQEAELITQLIRCGANLLAPVSVDGEEQNAVMMAARGGNRERIQLFALAPDMPFVCNEVTKDTQAHLAAACGDVETINMYLGTHPDLPYVRNAAGRTPLHAAATPYNRTFEAGHRLVIEQLLAKGAHIDARDNSERTPLHHAAAAGYFEIVRLLVKVGASVDATDNEDRTPLHLAAVVAAGSTALANDAFTACENLIDGGARVNALDLYGMKPLEADGTPRGTFFRGVVTSKFKGLAGRYPLQLVPWEAPVVTTETATPDQLARAKTSLYEAVRIGDLESMRAHLAGKTGAALDLAGEHSCTPLVRACIDGQADAVRLLLAAGAAVNHHASTPPAPHKGFTPLHFAAAHFRCSVVKALLEHGAEFQVAAEGTPLHVCAARNDLDILNTLVYGAPDMVRAHLNVENSDKATALQVACERLHIEMATRLLELGAKAEFNSFKSDVLIQSPSLCSLLLKAGAPLRTTDGVTLQMASIVQNVHLRQPPFVPLTKEQKELVKKMPPRGFTYKAGDSQKYQSIFGATREGDASAIGDFIYNVGHSVDRRHQSHSDTPLIWAAFYGRPFACALLVELGCDLDLRGEKDGTALYWATRKAYEHCAVVLLYLGADPAIPDNVGSTPLHQAAKNGLTKTIIHLLNYGAPINDVDNFGDNALHNAARVVFVYGTHRPHLYFTDAMESRTDAPDAAGQLIATLLCQNGITRNVTNKSGQKPINFARDTFKATLTAVIDSPLVSRWSPLHHDTVMYEHHHAMRTILMLRLTDANGVELFPTVLWNMLPLEVVYLFFEHLVVSNRVFVGRPREFYQLNKPVK